MERSSQLASANAACATISGAILLDATFVLLPPTCDDASRRRADPLPANNMPSLDGEPVQMQPPMGEPPQTTGMDMGNEEAGGSCAVRNGGAGSARGLYPWLLAAVFTLVRRRRRR